MVDLLDSSVTSVYETLSLDEFRFPPSLNYEPTLQIPACDDMSGTI